MKKLTITSKDISSKQWSDLILELNLMKKGWHRYGVDINIQTPGITKIISWGTKKYDAKGKFGRILGDIIVDNKSMSETMIQEHHAVPYYGQSKEDIQESHLANRKFFNGETI